MDNIEELTDQEIENLTYEERIRLSSKNWVGYPDKGPWFEEPLFLTVDNELQMEEYKGKNYTFKYYPLRMDYGNWNGYVVLPKEHPAFGVNYSQLLMDVHGDLTFSSDTHFDGSDKKGEMEEWTLGFDTAHFSDYSPHINRNILFGTEPNKQYRTLDYVIDEIKNLCKQLDHFTESDIHENPIETDWE